MHRLLNMRKGKARADVDIDAKHQILVGRGHRSQAAVDGLVALLTFGKDSTDGFGLAKGVLGGLLYVIDTARLFESNKQEWTNFAAFLSGLHDDVMSAIRRFEARVPPDLADDLQHLQRPLLQVALDMKQMSLRSNVAKLLQAREDPKKIAGFRVLIDSATTRFTVVRLVNVERVLGHVSSQVQQVGLQVGQVGHQMDNVERQIDQIALSMQKISHNKRLGTSTPSSLATRLLKPCPPPTHAYTGRKDILDQMDAYFSPVTGKRRVFVLYGLGGAGKTQVGCKFVEMNQFDRETQRFSEVFYMDASTKDTLIADFKALAIAKEVGKRMEDALNWLARHNEEWLLFFNNADDPKLNIKQYFPSCSHGNILITTRNRAPLGHSSAAIPHCNVGAMSLSDATSLLLQMAGLHDVRSHEKKDASHIVTVSHLFSMMLNSNHSLAIAQAGVFVFKTHCTLARYLTMYRQRHHAVLELFKHDLDGYQYTVYTAWIISFEQLQRRNVEAAAVLQLCAFFHHDNISRAMFRNAVENLLQPDNDHKLMEENEANTAALAMAKAFLAAFADEEFMWDELKFLRLLADIQSYSLIQYDRNTETFSIHPLVHKWCLTTMAAAFVIGRSVQWHLTTEDYAYRRSLLPHLDVIAQTTDGLDPSIVLEIALAYYESGRHDESERLVDFVVQAQARIFGEHALSTLKTLAKLASVYAQQGRWAEAQAIDETVLRVRRLELGDEHPHTLVAMNNLGITHREQGRWHDAEALFLQVRDARERILGRDHPDTLRVQSNLAETFRLQGREKEAEELDLTVIAARTRTLGEGHPDTLMAMGRLAASYAQQGRHIDANKLRDQVFDIYQRTTGERPQSLAGMPSPGLERSVWLSWSA
ncbi:hypothetical protein BD626DRAFT_544908 [Schizophyllum amplum]|uniref:DUF7779 domain-containing protein n=1 Tax=Schizophyllum amplum TaxID=97359 RepID=A0A550CRJ0_9AGAR|nr:hypothetical protein BD626DRAFT_544908 [Auriculariopsis ampla]